MTRYHYDRFDTPDDEQNGKWSVNFRTNPQGDIDQAVMSLDEAEVVFGRKPDPIDPKLMTDLPGGYETPTGVKVRIASAADGKITMTSPGGMPTPLTQIKGLVFRTPQFSDVTFEFVVQNGKVSGLKQRTPSGEMTFPKK
jgi:hypothetical protein